MNYDETIPYEDIDVADVLGDVDELPVFEVWALGYTYEHCPNDAEVLLDTFSDPDAAVAFAKEVTLADVVNKTECLTGMFENIPIISIEVETVVNMPDDEFGTTNVGTIFRKFLLEPAMPDDEDEYSEVIPLMETDYTLLEDGSIEVACSILKDYNKNDMVQFMFVEENSDTTPILTYKIISKTTGNTYICEFEY